MESNILKLDLLLNRISKGEEENFGKFKLSYNFESETRFKYRVIDTESFEEEYYTREDLYMKLLKYTIETSISIAICNDIEKLKSTGHFSYGYVDLEYVDGSILERAVGFKQEVEISEKTLLRNLERHYNDSLGTFKGKRLG